MPLLDYLLGKSDEGYVSFIRKVHGYFSYFRRFPAIVKPVDP